MNDYRRIEVIRSKLRYWRVELENAEEEVKERELQWRFNLDPAQRVCECRTAIGELNWVLAAVFGIAPAPAGKETTFDAE